MSSYKRFRTSDVITKVIEMSDSGCAFMYFEHIPSRLSVAGPCHTFTQKDELRLLNALRDLVNETWSDPEEQSYCEECNRINR